MLMQRYAAELVLLVPPSCDDAHAGSGQCRCYKGSNLMGMLPWMHYGQLLMAQLIQQASDQAVCTQLTQTADTHLASPPGKGNV